MSSLYIPVEKEQLIAILQNCLPPEEREKFASFARLLEHACHYQGQSTLNQLYNSYKPFNAGIETEIQIDEAQEQHYAKDLIHKIQKLLKQFQYQEISEYDILDILSASKREFAARFPLEKYQEFLVYSHGDGAIAESLRKPGTLWLKQHPVKVPYYQKLIVLFRPFRAVLKKREAKALRYDIGVGNQKITMPRPITLKLFQNIPHRDLTVIFPEMKLTLPLRTQFYWTVLLASAAVSFAVIPISGWFGLAGTVPLTMLGYALYRHGRRKKRYYENLLSHFYYNSISSNQGVLSYLIEQTQETTYKQLLVIFHAFWRRETWAMSEIHIAPLTSYLSHFFWKYCGVRVALNCENMIVECGRLLNHKNSLPSCVAAVSAPRAYLNGDAASGARYLDLKPSTTSLPRGGIVRVAPGTPKEEKHTFSREPFRLQLEQGLQNSHNSGTAIRYLVEEPGQTRLAEDVPAGANYLPVSEIRDFPLQGSGRVIGETDSWEFRYHREKNGDNLILSAGLRYRHTPSHDSPVLVRPVLPSFKLAVPLEAGTIEIPVPDVSKFPAEGYVRLAKGTGRDFVTAYVVTETFHGFALLITDKTPVTYEAGIEVTLTPPMSEIAMPVAKGSWLIPVKETKTFGNRGAVILSPGTQQEERCPFYREALQLELERPLKYVYSKGSSAYLENVKSKLISKAKKGSRSVMVQGVAADITRGTITISSPQNLQETCDFKLSYKYLYLGKPTENYHPEKSEVWESTYESPLRYEVFQGSYLIPVEDASAFPLRGTLQIDFNKNSGIIEVFPFQRTPGSNTLTLSSGTETSLKKGTPVLISKVDVSAKDPLHYGDPSIHADFFCMSDFPEHGKLLIDPGSPVEEEVEFRRFPQRLYLKEPLQDEHSLGTAVELDCYAETVLARPLDKNTARLDLDYGNLLPTRGCLLFKTGERVDTVWYRKLPRRVLLPKPCRFPHNLGSSGRFLGIEENVCLASYLAKGEKQVRVINAQELPIKGRLKIKSLFRSRWVEFVREGDTLYLKNTLGAGFSTRARLSLPNVQLATHLAPGSDYLEVSDPTLMPKSGKILLEKAYHTKMYKRKNRHEEILPFKYCPDTLWLDSPLEKSYEAGTVVFSPELFVQGAGELQMNSVENSQKIFNQWLLQQLNLK